MAKVEHNSNNGIYTYIKTLESYFKNQLVGIKNIIWIIECEKITYVFYSFPHKIVSAHTHKTTNKSWPILMKLTKYWEIKNKCPKLRWKHTDLNVQSYGVDSRV